MDRNDPRTATEICNTFGAASSNAMGAGDLPAAMSTARQVLEDDLLSNHSYLSASRLIPPLVLTGELDEALSRANAMWVGWERAGSPAAMWLTPAVSAIALAYGLRNDHEKLRLWRSRAFKVLGAAHVDDRFHLSAVTFVDARLAIHTGELADAPALVERASAELPYGTYEVYVRAIGAELAVAARLPDAAGILSSAVSRSRENDWAAACLARATGRLHGDIDALTASLDGWERIGARVERACTLLLLPGRAAEGRAELSAIGLQPPPPDRLLSAELRSVDRPNAREHPVAPPSHR
jgi:hypothetical protein